jgi:hypothetical protein
MMTGDSGTTLAWGREWRRTWTADDVRTLKTLAREKAKKAV